MSIRRKSMMFLLDLYLVLGMLFRNFFQQTAQRQLTATPQEATCTCKVPLGNLCPLVLLFEWKGCDIQRNSGSWPTGSKSDNQ